MSPGEKAILRWVKTRVSGEARHRARLSQEQRWEPSLWGCSRRHRRQSRPRAGSDTENQPEVAARVLLSSWHFSS